MSTLVLRTYVALAGFTILAGCKTDGMLQPNSRTDDTRPVIAQVAPQGSGLGRSAIADSAATGLLMQRRTFGIASQPDLDTYLNGLLAKLQRGWPTEPAPARVYVMPGRDFSAYSTKDGGIFLAVGMLESLESEDEVSAVLAHEYAHVLLRHHDTNVVNDLSQHLYGAGSLYLSLRSGGVGGPTDSLLQQTLMNEAALEASQTAIMPALTREQEEQADRLGTDLLLRAGYSMRGNLDFLSRMAEWEERNATAKAERRRQSEELAAASQRKSSDTVPQLSLAPLFERVKLGLSDAYDDMRRKHDHASQREESLRTYLRTAHAEAPRPTPATESWRAIMTQPSVRDFLAGLRQAEDARQALQRRDGRTARTLAQQAMAGPARGVALVRLSAVEAFATTGQSRDAVQLLASGVTQPDSILAEHRHFIATMERQSPAKGLAAAKDSARVFDDAPELLPDLIRLNRRVGDKNAATLLLAKCIALGNRQLTQVCQDAMKG